MTSSPKSTAPTSSTLTQSSVTTSCSYVGQAYRPSCSSRAPRVWKDISSRTLIQRCSMASTAEVEVSRVMRESIEACSCIKEEIG
ncbi:hypothetical protein Nepgr_024729 [Nepenthes gracilis]|uniref:Uncharacterized protein n=1 Tax=Nepenthes gracilis TaxID=150966 RepID=A0AAD3T5A4_NEPGR|nr:hypothetical protein Nepgr_024729 [Nepenthes gracilis]